eukprot:scaffold599280_cov52-Prasinocladus_malaysianus.AAC.1
MGYIYTDPSQWPASPQGLVHAGIWSVTLYLSVSVQSLEGGDLVLGHAACRNRVSCSTMPTFRTVAVDLAAEVIPLLQDVRQGDMMGNLESLTATASTAAEDIHRLQNEVLTKENVDALRQSVITLTKTLDHIEHTWRAHSFGRRRND